MRWFILIVMLLGVMVLAGVGHRGQKFTSRPIEIFPDMDRQFKLKTQKPSEFFADGSGSRKPVAGTVPIGFAVAGDGGPAEFTFSHGPEYASTGMIGEYFGDGFPTEYPVDEALIERGRERFKINCSMCHGLSGNGVGIVSKYWTLPPTANLLDSRVQAFPDGQIFWTITHGKGLMGPYNGTIAVRDRWAIVSYVRALQKTAQP
ncbi:MAG: cytochrome c [Verrucomicrobiales bacterium]|nr:cytochrome c [Verrucomicrobiae bacterium]MCP5554440.1 cytochrome c [Akkermansiaceae bacterium]